MNMAEVAVALIGDGGIRSIAVREIQKYRFRPSDDESLGRLMRSGSESGARS